MRNAVERVTETRVIALDVNTAKSEEPRRAKQFR